MTQEATVFEDDSSIEWIDKETLRYKEGELSALIWVNFESGFFANRRIIKSASIDCWEQSSSDKTRQIEIIKKQEIIDKVKRYYGMLGKDCQVDDS